ncbi:Metalloprotease family, partial [Globisporangium splendens]
MVAKRASKTKAGLPKLTPEEKAAQQARQQTMQMITAQYQNYDVVWTKMTGYPWWPGIVFLDWDALQDGGIELPKDGVSEIPPPKEMTVAMVNALGKTEEKKIVVKHCLVLCLDNTRHVHKANMRTEILPFTSYYHVHCNPSHKKGKGYKQFKLAVQRAVRLVHLGNDFTQEELNMLQTPPPEKRQRVEPSMQPYHGSRNEDSEWEIDDEESSEEEEDDDDDDGDFVLDKQVPPIAKLKAPVRKKSSAVERTPRTLHADFNKADAKVPPTSRTNTKRTKQNASQEQQSFVGLAESDEKAPVKGHKKLAAKAIGPYDSTAVAYVNNLSQKKAAAKKKAVGKAGTNADAIEGPSRKGKVTVLDLAADFDKRTKAYKQIVVESKKLSELQTSSAEAVKTKKPRKKKPASKDISTQEEDDDDGVEFIENAGTAPNDTSSSDDMVFSTPLSGIWTKHVETLTTGDANPNGEGPKKLAYKQDFVWDKAVFTNNDDAAMEKKSDTTDHENSPARPLGKRQMRSVQQAHIRQNLMSGNLDPHTMVQCESYRSRDEAENLSSRSRGSGSLDPPFQVQVHPDAVFVCDLHAHLATCEIIGFLGGRWDEVNKILYIQAAFPCRSLMIDGDDGSTDVEMDPGSEIELRQIIQNAELEVVGWYHSHPAFAPDPSIRDIENQTSYQQLFQRRIEKKTEDQQSAMIEVSEPFVGLIVSTYDTKRDTPVSLFRYFHTRGEKVSGGAIREVYMPYELVPTKRQYRSVLHAEKFAHVSKVTMYPSVQRALKLVSPSNDADFKSDCASSSTASDAIVVSSKNISSTQARKRKLGSEVTGPLEKPVKKGKRGRKPRGSVVPDVVNHDGDGQIDLTGDDFTSLQNAANSKPDVVIIDEEVASVVAENVASYVKTDRKNEPVTTLHANEKEAVDAEDRAVPLPSGDSNDSNGAAVSKDGQPNQAVNAPEEAARAEKGESNPATVEVEMVAVVDNITSTVESTAAGICQEDHVHMASESPELKKEKEVTDAASEKPQEAVAVVEKEIANVVDSAQEVDAAPQRDESTKASEDTTIRRTEVKMLRNVVEQKRRSTSFDTSNKRRSTRNSRLPDTAVVTQPPVTIDLAGEDEAPEDTKTVEMVSADVATSTTPPSLGQDNSINNNSAGRRRNRKPAQIIRRMPMAFRHPVSRGGHSPQSGTVATQIEVYGAFGSVGGSATRDVTVGVKVEPEREIVDGQRKAQNSTSDPVVKIESVKNTYVIFEFNSSSNNDETPTVLKVEDEPKDSSDSVKDSSSGVVENTSEAADEVVAESAHSQSSSAEQEGIATAAALDDDASSVVNDSPVAVKIEREESVLNEEAIHRDVTIKPSSPSASASRDEADQVSTSSVIMEVKEATGEPEHTSAADIKPSNLQILLSQSDAVKPEATLDDAPPQEEEVGVVTSKNSSQSLPAPADYPHKPIVPVVMSEIRDEIGEPAQPTAQVTATMAASSSARETENSVNDLRVQVMKQETTVVEATTEIPVVLSSSSPVSQEDPNDTLLIPASSSPTLLDVCETPLADSVNDDSQSEKTDVLEQGSTADAAHLSSAPMPDAIESTFTEPVDGSEQVSSFDQTTEMTVPELESQSVQPEPEDDEIDARSEFVKNDDVQEEEKKATLETVDTMAPTCLADVSHGKATDSEIAGTQETETVEVESMEVDAASDLPINSSNAPDASATTEKVALTVAEHISSSLHLPGALVRENGRIHGDHSPRVAPDHGEAELVKGEPEEDVLMVIVPESQEEEAEREEPVKEEIKEEVKEEAPALLLFGSGREREDIRTSLDRIQPFVEKMRAEREVAALSSVVTSVVNAAADIKDSEAKTLDEARPDSSVTASTDAGSNLFERQQAHLKSLRTNYGKGISGCAEQVVTLVDYYRDFERRIDLNEHWKSKISKLHKIEASLTEYVRYVNLPVHLRQPFIADLIGYLKLSWELTKPVD